VAVTGPQAGDHARHISELIDENQTDVGRATGRGQSSRGGRGKRRR
jgi:hypothetical protein